MVPFPLNSEQFYFGKFYVVSFVSLVGLENYRNRLLLLVLRIHGFRTMSKHVYHV